MLNEAAWFMADVFAIALAVAAINAIQSAIERSRSRKRREKVARWLEWEPPDEAEMLARKYDGRRTRRSDWLTRNELLEIERQREMPKPTETK